MMASLYPSPLDVDVALEEAGIEDIGGQRTQKLSGGAGHSGVRCAIGHSV